MPDTQPILVSGVVTHIFAHRFVLRTGQGDLLADLTPKGSEQITLRIDDEVTVEGEMKPSELKVGRLTRGGDTVTIAHKPKPQHHHPSADASVALAAVRAAGFTVVGEPRRKPKHFEVLGQHADAIVELHVELDGHIRETRPVDAGDAKWSEELQATRSGPGALR